VRSSCTSPWRHVATLSRQFVLMIAGSVSRRQHNTGAEKAPLHLPGEAALSSLAAVECFVEMMSWRHAGRWHVCGVLTQTAHGWRLQRGSVSLLGFDAGFLDNSSPFVDFCLEERFKRFWSGPLLFDGRHAEFAKSADQCRIPKRRLQGGDQSGDDRFRCAARRIEAVPCGDVECGDAGFGRRRYIGQCWNALLACDRIGP